MLEHKILGQGRAGGRQGSSPGYPWGPRMQLSGLPSLFIPVVEGAGTQLGLARNAAIDGNIAQAKLGDCK